MTAVLIYTHALAQADEDHLNLRLRALGQRGARPLEEESPPGLVFLGDERHAAAWQRRGHHVIVCGSRGAYSVKDALAFLPQLLPGHQEATLNEDVAELFSFGERLDPLVRDPAINDILVNGRRIWVDEGRGLRELEGGFESLQEVRHLAVRIAAYCGRRLDEASPIVDAALPSGIRLHAVLAPVAREGPVISLRIPHQQCLQIRDMCVGASANFLEGCVRAAVERRMNCLISGATGSGKTTLLSAVLSVIPDEQRLVCIEEISELRPDHAHVVHLQERAPNVQGVGGVSLSELVRAAVRMRPDRIIVGECRGAEVRDMLSALNTGHEGGWATIHANSVADVPARLAALGALGGLHNQALSTQVSAAFDLVIHMERGSDGRRRIGQIGVMGDDEGHLRCRLALGIDEDGACHLGPGWEECQALLGVRLPELGKALSGGGTR